MSAVADLSSTTDLSSVVERLTTSQSAQVLVIGHSFSNLEGFLDDVRRELEQRHIQTHVEADGKHQYKSLMRSESNVLATNAGEKKVVIASFLHSPLFVKGRRSVAIEGSLLTEHDATKPTCSRLWIINTDALNSDTELQALLDHLAPASTVCPPLVISLHHRRVLSTAHPDNLTAATALLDTNEIIEKWPRVVSSLVVPWLVPYTETSRQNIKAMVVSMSVALSPGYPWYRYRPMFVTRREICEGTATWVCSLTANNVAHFKMDLCLFRTHSMLNAHFGGNYSFFPSQQSSESSPMYILRYIRPTRQSPPPSLHNVLIDALQSVGWSVRRATDAAEWLPLVPPVTPHATLRVGCRVWNCQKRLLGTVVGFKAAATIKGLEHTLWPVVCYDSACDQAKPETDIEIPTESQNYSRLSWIEETATCLPIRFSGALSANQLVASDARCSSGVVGKLPPVAAKMGAFLRSPHLLMMALRYAKRPLMFHEVTSVEWMRRCIAQVHSRWYHNATNFLKP
jgi:hypothetical protein